MAPRNPLMGLWFLLKDSWSHPKDLCVTLNPLWQQQCKPFSRQTFCHFVTRKITGVSNNISDGSVPFSSGGWIRHTCSKQDADIVNVISYTCLKSQNVHLGRRVTQMCWEISYWLEFKRIFPIKTWVKRSVSHPQCIPMVQPSISLQKQSIPDNFFLSAPNQHGKK